MKVRINLTIEHHLLSKIKRYAAGQKTSVSGLVEGYFEKIAHASKRKTILDLLDTLGTPGIVDDKDLKRDIYKAQRKKYGF